MIGGNDYKSKTLWTIITRKKIFENLFFLHKEVQQITFVENLFEAFEVRSET